MCVWLPQMLCPLCDWSITGVLSGSFGCAVCQRNYPMNFKEMPTGFYQQAVDMASADKDLST